MISSETEKCAFNAGCPGCYGAIYTDASALGGQPPFSSQHLAQIRLAYDTLEPWDDMRVDNEDLAADLEEARAALAEVLRENQMEVSES